MKVSIRDNETCAIVFGTTFLSLKRFDRAFRRAFDPQRFSYRVVEFYSRQSSAPSSMGRQ